MGVVRPFEDVQANDLVFEADPTDPGRAVFRVTTTEPMICAIVWGPDEAFGRFNNSLAMSGTGIEQHDVLLPDVEPGATYHYVVQGSTADGVLYRSEVGTFSVEALTGPEGRDPADRLDQAGNLTRGATVVEASSAFSEEFAPERALDGDLGTEWATRGDGDEGHIVVDLGSAQAIGGVEFITRSMADGSSVTDTFTVAVGDGPTFGPFPAATVAQPRVAELRATGRRLCIEVDSSTGGNVGAVEIAVYGA